MSPDSYSIQMSTHRPVAMALSIVAAVVLSPLYVTRNNSNETKSDIRWNTGFILPLVLAGLIIAIKTTSSTFSSTTAKGGLIMASTDPNSVIRFGGSSWGLAGVLIMLMLVLSWQTSLQHFFWN
ncbi:hypothetical protein RND81_05G245200 [Saponaria officinalis]|uniref:Uncharacterized protein n=1 Tax=Saponaria officinalis TaxID=3572 RepID=A0AAW1L0X5_SAPOF